ncbi:MAG: S-layer family protein [Leptolyngbya sp. SIO4C1]|nr:S-layer family protein [Leptolyngbya sp. SIO4C1]
MLLRCLGRCAQQLGRAAAEPRCVRLGFGSLSGWLLLSVSSAAQVATSVQPDSTLPTVSAVSGAGTVTVTGGTVDRSGNLFHSFEQLSIGSGDRVLFELGAQVSDIQTIITRVTGVMPSALAGTLAAEGSADFFLINPNGIVVGPAAALELGGSFIASTAESVVFPQLSFSAVAPSVPSSLPRLTLSMPIGLQYGTAPSGISVTGPGHGLFIDPISFELVQAFRPAGLAVETGQTLALAGGEVSLSGGNLTAPEGRILLGGRSQPGQVGLVATQPGWQLVYPEAAELSDIRLTAAASADVSGSGGGELQLRGRQIQLSDGAALLSNTLGMAEGQSIQLRATDAIAAIGSDIDPVTQLALFPSGVFAEVAAGATGAGSEILIETADLQLRSGGQLSTTTFGDGSAGRIAAATERIEIVGQSPDEFFFSGIFGFADLFARGDGGDLQLQTQRLLLDKQAEISTNTFGKGQAGSLRLQAEEILLLGESGLFANTDFDAIADGGDLMLETGRLRLEDGSQIGTSTFGVGNAGRLQVSAQRIELSGGSDFSPSGLFAVAELDSTGQGGQLHVQTQQLRILDGAQIATSTLGSGKAGNLTVLAETVELSGGNQRGRSSLLATALLDTGDGGDLSLVSNRLSLQDGAVISVSNFPSGEATLLTPGQGAAGNLSIRSGSVQLDNQARLSAETVAGAQGNVALQTELLLLRRGSQITTNATGTASGGSILIDASRGFVVAIPTENSDITANAVTGDGGRVDILAQGLLGIAPRPALTPLSDITASSEFGLAGEVVVITPEANPDERLEQLPSLQAIPQLAQGCAAIAERASRFVVSGRSGLRAAPARALSSAGFLDDVQLPQAWTSLVPSVEAQSWYRGEDGVVRLAAVAEAGRCPRGAL